MKKAAIAYQQLGEREKELQAMKQVNELSSDALFALKPLMEQAKTEQDWEAMLTYANKWLSIQPLQAYGHEQLAEAAMKLERPEQALSSLQSLRSLDPADPAGLSLKLAQTHWKLGDAVAAKRAVLEALEIAPRYREAHRLLLEIHRDKEPKDQNKPASAELENLNTTTPELTAEPEGR